MDTSRLNASSEAISKAIMLLQGGHEGMELCAALQNAHDYMIALVGIQARNIAALTAQLNEHNEALRAANAHIEELQDEVAAAMDAMMPDRTILTGSELPF